MGEDADFFAYQKTVNPSITIVPSHLVMKEYIEKNGKDYRYQEGAHPIHALDDRMKDNTKEGRDPSCG